MHTERLQQQEHLPQPRLAALMEVQRARGQAATPSSPSSTLRPEREEGDRQPPKKSRSPCRAVSLPYVATYARPFSCSRPSKIEESRYR